MRLAVSNIAWSSKKEEDALAILKRAGIGALEIAPTRWWPEWKDAATLSAVSHREKYAALGFSIPSWQAILFAKPTAKLFGNETERDTLMSHLHFCAELAAAAGARRLVFGAPKNRARNGFSPETAFGMAREFFASVANFYAQRGLSLCFEANPPQYDCTFATNSVEAARLVRAVDSPGFRLHLDTACMYLAGEDIPAALRANADILDHFHVSEPFLGSFMSCVIDHRRVSQTLREVAYGGSISLEMRETEEPIADLRTATEFLAKTYGGEN